jgi:hypothetical protein
MVLPGDIHACDLRDVQAALVLKVEDVVAPRSENTTPIAAENTNDSRLIPYWKLCSVALTSIVFMVPMPPPAGSLRPRHPAARPCARKGWNHTRPALDLDQLARPTACTDQTGAGSCAGVDTARGASTTCPRPARLAS